MKLTTEQLKRYIKKIIKEQMEEKKQKPEQRSSVLLNNYIQSTAVTVALLGFSQIIERIYQYGIQDIICPLMVLHDALILDIHKDAEHIISKLERLGSTGIPGFKDVDFFLRSEILL